VIVFVKTAGVRVTGRFGHSRILIGGIDVWYAGFTSIETAVSHAAVGERCSESVRHARTNARNARSNTSVRQVLPGSTYVNYAFMMFTLVRPTSLCITVRDFHEVLAAPLLVYCVVMRSFCFDTPELIGWQWIAIATPLGLACRKHRARLQTCA